MINFLFVTSTEKIGCNYGMTIAQLSIQQYCSIATPFFLGGGAV